MPFPKGSRNQIGHLLDDNGKLNQHLHLYQLLLMSIISS